MQEYEEVEYYFAYSASLRIFGDNIDLDEVNDLLKVEPSSFNKAGDKFVYKGKETSRTFEKDVWKLSSPLNEEIHLDEHLNYLKGILIDKSDAIGKLKEKYEIDIFCGYRSNCDHAGFKVNSKSLELFTELDVDFNVSVIIT